MQLSQEIFNILKGANIKLKLFDPAGNKTLDPEVSARFYAYDRDFLITIRDEDGQVELVVQAGASFNFDEHKDVLNSIKKAGHNAMAEYNIRKFDKRIEPKDFAHDVVKETEEIRRLKELSGIKEADRSDVTHAQLLPHIKNVKAAIVKHAADGGEDASEFIEHLDDMMNAGDVEVVDMMQPDYMDTEARDSLVGYFEVSISKDPALYKMLFPGEDINWAQGEYANMFESPNEEGKIEEAFFLAPWILPALATAARVGGPALFKLLKHGKNAVGKTKVPATNAAQAIIKNPGTTLSWVGGGYVFKSVYDVVEKVKELVGDFMDEASIESFAQLVWKYKLPVAAVVAVLYGGKKLKDYMAGEDEKGGDTTINNYYNDKEQETGIGGMTQTYGTEAVNEAPVFPEEVELAGDSIWIEDDDWESDYITVSNIETENRRRWIF